MRTRRKSRLEQSGLYTGELAKPMAAPFYFSEFDLMSLPDWFPRDTLRDQIRTRRMELLFEHYQVKSEDWKALAIKLAAVHVPGLQVIATIPRRGRGRPRKLPKFLPRGLGHVAIAQPASERKPPGRPVFWTPERSRALVKMADRWKAQERKHGKAATDIGFVRWYCAKNNLHRTRAQRAIANALSRARKAVSKP